MGGAGKSEPTKAQVLEAERAVNERYQRELEELVKKSPELASAVGAPGSATWTGHAPKSAVSHAVISPIVGRVGFRDAQLQLGRGFYVGGLWGRQWEGDGEDVIVVAWAAPVASLFYDGADSGDESVDDLGGCRTFRAKGPDVHAFEDDLQPGVSSSGEVFPLPGAGKVAVPAAPRPVVRPERPVARPATPTRARAEAPAPAPRHEPAPAHVPAPPPVPAPVRPPQPPIPPPSPVHERPSPPDQPAAMKPAAAEEKAPAPPSTPTPPTPMSGARNAGGKRIPPPPPPPPAKQIPPPPPIEALPEAPKPEPIIQPEPMVEAEETVEAPEHEVMAPAAEATPAEPLVGLRAEMSVREAIEAPRTGHLGSVLSTLQPDQYHLVRWPSDMSLVVQGQPGTGKTIIATHRAAYLVHPEREGGALARVGIAGPTEAWARHVSSSIQQLGAMGVQIFDMQTMLADLSGVGWNKMEEGPEERIDTSWGLGLFLAKAVPALRAGHIGAFTVPAAVKLLTSMDPRIEPHLTGRPEIRSWLQSAKNWNTMSQHRRYLPALAAIGQAIGRGDGPLLDHLIVDEAQDVRPLEWQLLVRRMKAGGSLTLVGDLNQRRSDWTHAKWEDLAGQLDIADSNGEIHVEVISIGYRSTKRILKFANQLLPKGQRTVGALREGTDPAVQKVRQADLEKAVIEAALQHAAAHAPGMVAVITMAPRSISDQFRRLGWLRPVGLTDGLEKDGQTLMVLHPERARGLEFDAVVVVEPNEFPENVGRIGSLYTSLTRATKELTVLHSKGLPKDLRPPR